MVVYLNDINNHVRLSYLLIALVFIRKRLFCSLFSLYFARMGHQELLTVLIEHSITVPIYSMVMIRSEAANKGTSQSI